MCSNFKSTPTECEVMDEEDRCPMRRLRARDAMTLPQGHGICASYLVACGTGLAFQRVPVFCASVPGLLSMSRENLRSQAGWYFHVCADCKLTYGPGTTWYFFIICLPFLFLTTPYHKNSPHAIQCVLKTPFL